MIFHLYIIFTGNNKFLLLCNSQSEIVVISLMPLLQLQENPEFILSSQYYHKQHHKLIKIIIINNIMEYRVLEYHEFMLYPLLIQQRFKYVLTLHNSELNFFGLVMMGLFFFIFFTNFHTGNYLLSFQLIFVFYIFFVKRKYYQLTLLKRLNVIYDNNHYHKSKSQYDSKSDDDNNNITKLPVIPFHATKEDNKSSSNSNKPLIAPHSTTTNIQKVDDSSSTTSASYLASTIPADIETSQKTSCSNSGIYVYGSDANSSRILQSLQTTRTSHNATEDVLPGNDLIATIEAGVEMRLSHSSSLQSDMNRGSASVMMSNAQVEQKNISSNVSTIGVTDHTNQNFNDCNDQFEVEELNDITVIYNSENIDIIDCIKNTNLYDFFLFQCYLYETFHVKKHRNSQSSNDHNINELLNNNSNDKSLFEYASQSTLPTNTFAAFMSNNLLQLKYQNLVLFVITCNIVDSSNYWIQDGIAMTDFLSMCNEISLLFDLQYIIHLSTDTSEVKSYINVLTHIGSFSSPSSYEDNKSNMSNIDNYINGGGSNDHHINGRNDECGSDASISSIPYNDNNNYDSKNVASPSLNSFVSYAESDKFDVNPLQSQYKTMPGGIHSQQQLKPELQSEPSRPSKLGNVNNNETSFEKIVVISNANYKACYEEQPPPPQRNRGAGAYHHDGGSTPSRNALPHYTGKDLGASTNRNGNSFSSSANKTVRSRSQQSVANTATNGNLSSQIKRSMTRLRHDYSNSNTAFMSRGNRYSSTDKPFLYKKASVFSSFMTGGATENVGNISFSNERFADVENGGESSSSNIDSSFQHIYVSATGEIFGFSSQELIIYEMNLQFGLNMCDLGNMDTKVK